MTSDNHPSVRDAVRDHYARIGQPEPSAPCAPGCCGANPEASRKLGYSQAELAALPEGANLGLGCGNPQAIAALRLGDTVLDLGSGGGIDSFLAARRVGPTGHVIGVDMTPEILARARGAATRMGLDNVEFRLGEIEHLPVAEASVDVILSNCVINLSPDKAQALVHKIGHRTSLDLDYSLRNEVARGILEPRIFKALRRRLAENATPPGPSRRWHKMHLHQRARG